MLPWHNNHEKSLRSTIATLQHEKKNNLKCSRTRSAEVLKLVIIFFSEGFCLYLKTNKKNDIVLYL